FEDAHFGPEARPGDRPPYRAGDARRVRSEAWLALSCATPAGRKRLACLGVGRIGEQPPGEILQAHEGWRTPASERRGELGARLAGHYPRASSHHLAEVKNESAASPGQPSAQLVPQGARRVRTRR